MDAYGRHWILFTFSMEFRALFSTIPPGIPVSSIGGVRTKMEWPNISVTQMPFSGTQINPLRLESSSEIWSIWILIWIPTGKSHPILELCITFHVYLIPKKKKKDILGNVPENEYFTLIHVKMPFVMCRTISLPCYHQHGFDTKWMGVRQTYIWSQLNPKSKGKFAIKSKSLEITKSLNPSGGERQINTIWQLYRMANTFYTLIRGSGEVKYSHSFKESIPTWKKGTACKD